MQKIKNLSGSAAILLAALAVTISVPAFAEVSTTGSTGDSTSSSSTQTTTETSRETPRESVQTQREQVHTDREQLATDKQTLHEDVKAAQAQKKSEEKIKVCEAHKKGLETKFSHITTNATNVDNRISEVLTKVEKYQTNNNVQVANFASLDATAQADGQKAADAIANLKAVTPSVDCNSTSVASDVASFKTAAANTRDSLKAYRQAVLDVLHALEQAKTSTTKTTTGGSTND